MLIEAVMSDTCRTSPSVAPPSVASPSVARRVVLRIAPARRHAAMRGYIFAEASLCVAIAAAAALPLALLAIAGLDTARRQRAMFDVAHVTAEAAESRRAPT